MNISTLLTSIRDAIHDDSATKTWCTANYTRNHYVYVGADQRNPPGDDKYPLVGMYLIGKKAGYGLDSEEHRIGVTCGLYDSSLAATGKANVVQYTGVANLEAFRKLVETAIKGAVSSPQRIEEINIEYEMLEFFPYFLCNMEIRIPDDYFQGDDVFK
jgi:hypothetical protein